MRAHLRALLAATTLFLGAGCGGNCPEAQQPTSKSDPPPVPKRTAAETEQLHELLYALGAKETCNLIRGTYSGLGAPHDPGVISGRLRIEQCEDKRNDNEIVLELAGRGWRWIDKKAEELGATFTVSEYAKLSADIRMPAKIDVAYAQEKQVLTLWLTPSERVKAEVTPLSRLNARPEGLWGELLGTAARLFTTGPGPDQQATKRLSQQANRKISQKLTRGYTVALDLCSGQRYEEMGHLEEGELPERPYPSPNRIWLGNERVRVHQGGVDLAGPYDTKSRVKVDIELEAGGSLNAKLICASDAALVADAFIAGEELPRVRGQGRALVVGGKPTTLEMDTSECPAVLMTEPGPSAKDAVTFRYMAYRPDATHEALVECKSD